MARSENDGLSRQAAGNNVQKYANIYEDERGLREHAQVAIKRTKSATGVFSVAVAAAVIVKMLLRNACEAWASWKL